MPQKAKMNKTIPIFLIIFSIFLVPIFASCDTCLLFSKFASNESLNTNGTGDYLLTPSNFKIQPPNNENWLVSRLISEVRDVGSLDSGFYGNNINLVNGIRIYANQSGIITNLTNTHPILVNTDWGHYSYDVLPLTFGLGEETLLIRWTFSKSGAFIFLNGTKGDNINIILNDDFTDLTEHHFVFQGYIDNTGFEQTTNDLLKQQGTEAKGNMWLPIILTISIMTTLYFVGAALIKTKEAMNIKAFLYMMGICNTFLLAGCAYLVALNPTAPETFLPVGIGYFTVNMIAMVYYIWAHGIGLMMRAFRQKTNDGKS